MSKFEEKVIQKITERSERGFKKYGVTMERKDLSLMDWLTHLQEELMDATVYVERLMKECECPIHGMEKHHPGTKDGFIVCPYCRRL